MNTYLPQAAVTFAKPLARFERGAFVEGQQMTLCNTLDRLAIRAAPFQLRSQKMI